MISTAGTTSTPHGSAERTAHLEKVFSQLGSLMFKLHEFWNEALAARIDGKIRLQAAELQELGDARQRAWINECAAVTDKLARTQEPEHPEETSVGHVEEDAWQEASSEACKSQTEGKPDLEDVRAARRANPRLRASRTWRMYASGSTSSGSKIDSRLMSRPKSSRGPQTGRTSARRCWTKKKLIEAGFRDPR